MGPRSKLIARIAPIAPPCFESRLQWVSYLQSAAEGQKDTRIFDASDSLVLVRDEADEYRVNPKFAYCRDCTAKHSHAMLTQGKCNKDWLKQLAAATEAQQAPAHQE
jgi:hypothetical protein